MGRLVFRVKGPCVYFLFSHDRTMVKIGKTLNLSQRYRDIATMNPFPVEVGLTVAGYTIVEGALHHRFRRHRSHGEWFRADLEILEFIDSIKSGRMTIDDHLPGASNADRPRLEQRHRL